MYDLIWKHSLRSVYLYSTKTWAHKNTFYCIMYVSYAASGFVIQIHILSIWNIYTGSIIIADVHMRRRDTYMWEDESRTCEKMSHVHVRRWVTYMWDESRTCEKMSQVHVRRWVTLWLWLSEPIGVGTFFVFTSLRHFLLLIAPIYTLFFKMYLKILYVHIEQQVIWIFNFFNC